MRSIPADAIWVGDMNFADLIAAVCPPAPAGGPVAIACPDLFHIRSSPSYELDNILSCPETIVLFPHVPAGDVAESTSTELTQSSCSNEASKRGGIKLRTYWSSNVVSEERPLDVRYSSSVVRRKVPFIKKSKGIGAWVSSIYSELRSCERPYLRRST